VDQRWAFFPTRIVLTTSHLIDCTVYKMHGLRCTVLPVFPRIEEVLPDQMGDRGDFISFYKPLSLHSLTPASSIPKTNRISGRTIAKKQRARTGVWVRGWRQNVPPCLLLTCSGRCFPGANPGISDRPPHSTAEIGYPSRLGSPHSMA